MRKRFIRKRIKIDEIKKKILNKKLLHENMYILVLTQIKINYLKKNKKKNL